MTWTKSNTLAIGSTLVGLIICRLENTALAVGCHWLWGGLLYSTIVVMGHQCRQWVSFFRCWIFLHSVIFSLILAISFHGHILGYAATNYTTLIHWFQETYSDCPFLALLLCCLDSHTMLCILSCLVLTIFHIPASPSFPHLPSNPACFMVHHNTCFPAK